MLCLLAVCKKLDANMTKGQVWYLIVSIPDLCTLTYFARGDVFPQLFLPQIMLRFHTPINNCSVMSRRFLILEPVLSSVNSVLLKNTKQSSPCASTAWFIHVCKLSVTHG